MVMVGVAVLEHPVGALAGRAAGSRAAREEEPRAAP